MAPSTSSWRVDAAQLGVLMDHGDVVVDGQILDRLLGLERAPQAPAGAAEVAIESRSSPNALTLPEAGRTKPERTLKNVVLPAPLGPISPQVPRLERDAHAVQRRDAAEADGEPGDLDHGAGSLPAPARRPRPPM